MTIHEQHTGHRGAGSRPRRAGHLRRAGSSWSVRVGTLADWSGASGRGRGTACRSSASSIRGIPDPRACGSGAATWRSIPRPIPCRSWARSIASMNWSTAPAPPMSCWPSPESGARSSRRGSARLVNPDVSIHCVSVDSGSLELDSLASQAAPAAWAAEGTERPRAWLRPSHGGRLAWGRIGKRLVDISVAATLLVLLSPLFAVVALAILISSGQADLLQATAHRARRTIVPHHQVPKHEMRRRARDGADLGAGSRRAMHPDRRLAPAHEHRRAPAVDQRRARRDEPGGSASRAADLRGRVPSHHPRLRPASRDARRDDGLGPGPRLAGTHLAPQAAPVRPGLHPSLVDRTGPSHPPDDHPTRLLGKDLVERIQASRRDRRAEHADSAPANGRRPLARSSSRPTMASNCCEPAWPVSRATGRADGNAGSRSWSPTTLRPTARRNGCHRIIPKSGWFDSSGTAASVRPRTPAWRRRVRRSSSS